MTITKVISGGQTGADIGALEAAKELGLETGGFVPLECLTEDGPNMKLLDYGCVETGRGGYAIRTYKNVESCDAVLLFAKDLSSSGTKCTINACKHYDRHLFIIDMANPQSVAIVKVWLRKKKIRTLMVAGHRESKCPGIREFVKEYLIQVLKKRRNKCTQAT